MGSRKTHEGAKKVYTAAELWVDCALRRDDSLFTPGKAIWTRELLGMARERWMESTVEVTGGFHERLRAQLGDSPNDLFQLMGEALYVHFLVIHSSNMKGETKRKHIDTILQWSSEPMQIPEQLIQSLQQGIGGTGVQFLMGRPYHLGFLIEFAEQWKSLRTSEQEHILGDPWRVKKFVMDLNFRSDWLRDAGPDVFTMQREALFHLFFPDTFERVFPPYQKELIANSFADLVTESTEDVDRKLQNIRKGIQAVYNRDFDFYDNDILDRWEPESMAWAEFVQLAKLYETTGRLEEEELTYKIEVAEELAKARRAVLDGSDNWSQVLREALPTSKANFIQWRQISNLHRWCAGQTSQALHALRVLWNEGNASVEERIRAFAPLLPNFMRSGAGTNMRLIAGLLMALDAERYPPFMITVFRQTYQRTGYTQPRNDADEAALYLHALGFLDRFIDEAAQRDLELRHRLDAQSFVWAIREGRGREDDDDDSIEENDEQIDVPTHEIDLASLAEEVFLPVEFLKEIETLLEEKKQVIFQGPPGTGKTFVAQKLAEVLAGSKDRVNLVQFHPSYAYEDFIEGYRPVLKEGQATFGLRKGPLLRAADRAKSEPEADHFLIIDEINRGNIAKVFGELYFLLEYRDEPANLQYSDKPFSLPPNLYIIGTMNTADRSIALVDLALRRRFYFVEFHPDDEPVKGVLRRWLEAKAAGMGWVADVVENVNKLLEEDRHAAIGPSYFMKDNLDEDAVKRIWKHSVLPYIEERRFGADAVSDDFDLEKLRSSIQSIAPYESSQGLEEDGENGQQRGG